MPPLTTPELQAAMQRVAILHALREQHGQAVPIDDLAAMLPNTPRTALLNGLTILHHEGLIVVDAGKHTAQAVVMD